MSNIDDIIYTNAQRITPGTPITTLKKVPGVAIACSTAGIVRLVMNDGSFLDIYATVGTAIINDIAVKDVNAAGTTATVIVSALG